MNLNPDRWVEALQALPVEAVWCLMAFVAYSTVLLMLRLFGAAGLYAYIGMAVIAANLQVQTAAQFSFMDAPVALGTTLFASTFLCTDILNEHYGEKAAKKGVLIGFVMFALMTVFMFLTISYRPLDPETTSANDYWFIESRNHLSALFHPLPAILISSVVAYFASQYHDIWCYNLIKRLTHGRMLWLRNNISTLLSALIDNLVFSILAWKVLAAEPMPWDTVLVTFVLGTYVFRVILALLDTPVAYLAARCLPPEDRNQSGTTSS